LLLVKFLDSKKGNTMKKYLASSLLIGISLTLFSGCAYKTTTGIDQCGRSYTDITYRQYNKDCNPRSRTLILTKNECDPCDVTPTLTLQEMPKLPKNTPILKADKPLRISVVGQGVAPCNGSCSPSQAYALAKRAAIADAYRLIAEKVKGVYVEGNDLIKNMMVKRSTIKTSVAASVRNANVVETTFKEGLCEVEMEVVLSHSQFVR
jgi:hypothetical protein